ncbi:PH domain-containing protein [Cellulomonas marina]|nr:PH domain-containing protein [Cellulomonas marina]
MHRLQLDVVGVEGAQGADADDLVAHAPGEEGHRGVGQTCQVEGWFRWTAAVVVGGYALVLFALPVPGAVRVLQAGLLVQAALQAVAALGQRPGRRLVLDDEGLALRGPLRTRRCPWGDVTAVHGDAPGGRAAGTRLVVERRDARPLVLPPLGLAVPDLHALLVERVLDDRARAAGRTGPAGGTSSAGAGGRRPEQEPHPSHG